MRSKARRLTVGVAAALMVLGAVPTAANAAERPDSPSTTEPLVSRCGPADGSFNFVCIEKLDGYARAEYNRGDPSDAHVDLFIGWPNGSALVYQGTVAGGAGVAEGQAITGNWSGCYRAEAVVGGKSYFSPCVDGNETAAPQKVSPHGAGRAQSSSAARSTVSGTG